MGVFSWKCHRCGLSILNTMIDNTHYSKATVILGNGSIIHGEYDGYGRVGIAEDLADHKATWFHTKCWEDAGKPTSFLGQSDWAEDQGHFIDTRRYYGCPNCSLDECEDCAFCGETMCECICDEIEEEFDEREEADQLE